jgi:hypothetical protein
MLQALRARWSTALALLIAVATAWMFAASRPTSPPLGGESEIVCAHEVPVTPGISKQQDSGERGTPRGNTAIESTYACGVPFAQVLVLTGRPSGADRVDPRTASNTLNYPRGPPIRA